MMKKIIYILLIPFVIAGFMSCQDKLDEEYHSEVTQDFMKTPKGYKMALNSAYSVMKSWYGAEEGIHGLMNPGTDELKSNLSGGNRTSDMAQYHLDKFNTGNEYIRKIWDNSYSKINILNFLIENVDLVDVSTQDLTAAQRDQYLGEAKFLRAFFYFQMVQQFGDVTLATVYNTEPKQSASRQDMIDVYAVIMADLEDAVKKCSPSPQQNKLESGRASSATAQHLLSKVYLTLAWVYDKDASKYPKNPHNKYYNTGKAQEYYKKAYDTATKLIADAPSLGLKLMDNYADLFDEYNDAPSGRNKEELFVARMDWDLNNVYGERSTLNHYYVNGYDAYLGERNLIDGRCYSWNNPNEYTYNAFTNRKVDTRYNGTFQRVWYATKKVVNDKAGSNGDYVVTYPVNGVDQDFKWQLSTVGDTAIYYPGYKMTVAEINEMTQNRDGNKYIIFTPEAYNGRAIFPTITKFLDRTKAVPNDNSDRSFVIFRLGETYLLAAEAALKLNRPQDAAKYINLLRERAREKEKSAAGALDVQASAITLDFILEERTRELLAEHHRWADLARTGTLLERVKKYDEGPAAINIEDKHWLRPIPRSQIEAVVVGEPYPQNLGW